jgi:hypothetical protein
MIPERVYSVLSLTTKRAKTFDTSLGIFSYIQTSVEYFRIGLFQETVNQQYAFLIASREKALCDKMVYTRQLNLTSQKAVETYLEKDLRIEMQSLKTLDIEIIKQCYETGMKAAQLTHLFKLIKKLK